MSDSNVEDYLPNWKTRLFVRSIGKRRACSLLDAIQLMATQEFQGTQEHKVISESVTTTIIATNIMIITTSFFFSRTFFKSNTLFSPKKVLFDICLVGMGSYMGAFVLSEMIEKDVKKGKKPFLLRYDRDFMSHFDILASRYQIDGEIQTKGILEDVDLSKWLDGYSQKLYGSL